MLVLNSFFSIKMISIFARSFEKKGYKFGTISINSVKMAPNAEP